MAICALCLLLGGLLADPHVDRAADLLEQDQFALALVELEKADGSDSRADSRADLRYDELRTRAICGIARDHQRAEGYGAAVAYLEQHLENEAIVSQFVEVCIWAGEETRALTAIAALPKSLRDGCVLAEFQIHWVRLDFETLERRARETGEPTWVQFAQEQRALRAGFAAHATRARWIVIGAVLVMAGIWFVLFKRLSPAARTT